MTRTPSRRPKHRDAMPRWLERLVVAAWPPAARNRHARPLRQTLRAAWRDASQHSIACRSRERTALVVDALLSGLAERRAQRPARPPFWSVSMSAFLFDLRLSIRALTARPAATLAIVLTLGIGLGATAAMFGVMDAVLLKPLPYPQDEQLVEIAERHTTRPRSGVSFPAMEDWARLPGIASVGAWSESSGIIRVAGEPERLDGVMVSPTFFATMGVRAALGRTTIPGDPLLDPDPKIVLSHRVWRDRFGSQPDAVGQTVTLDGRTFTIIGIVPPEFDYPAGAAFWATLTPAMTMLVEDRLLRFLRVVARLEPSATTKDVGPHLETWRAAQTQAFPTDMADWRPEVRTLRDQAVGAVRMPIAVTFAGVTILLLIACCNVSVMLLAHGRDRRRALVVRTALGASRARLMRQLLIEGLLLSTAGAVLAVVASASARSAIVALSVDQIPRIDLAQTDWRLVAFVAIAGLLTTALFALGPAVWLSRVSSAELAGGSSRTVAGGGRRLFGALVATEFALALTLVATAGLLVNSYSQLSRIDLGMDPAGVVTARVNVPLSAPWVDDDKGTDHEKVRQFFAATLAALRGAPGVERAGLIARLPLEPLRGSIDVWPAGQRDRSVQTILQQTSEDYFAAIGARVAAGRDFTKADGVGQPLVVILNDVAVRHFWPDGAGLGRQVQFSLRGAARTATVIAVIEAIRYDGLAGELKPELYLSFRQERVLPLSLVLRSSAEPAGAVPAMRAAIRAADPSRTVTIDQISNAEDLRGAALATPRFFLALVGTFAVIAFLLAAVGIHGTLAFWIGQHRRELGIRCALGATREDIARLVIGRGMTIVGIGLLAGLAMTLAAGRFVRSMLFGVEPGDPATIVAATVALALVAGLACLIPARRAARLNPIETLHAGNAVSGV